MHPQKKIKTSDKNKKGKPASAFKTGILYLLPLIIAVGVVPLIVYLKVYELQGIKKEVWQSGGKVGDFFSYYKYVVLLFAAAAGLFSLFINRIHTRLPLTKTYTYIPLAVYALFAVVSAIASQYRDVASTGFVERFESVYALLAYVILAFITINLTSTQLHIKYIISALLISSLIMGLIGLSQYLGMDFFGTAAGKHLILPPQYQSAAKDLVFKFDKYIIYGTLYNPNYVGSYIVLVLPICAGIFLYEKKPVKKVLVGLLGCMLLICLIGSGSLAGLIGAVLAAVLLAVFLRRHIIKHIKAIAIICLSSLILLTGINYLTGGGISKRFAIFDNGAQAPHTVYIKDIILKDNTIGFVTDEQSVFIKLDNNNLYFYDDKNNALAVKQEQDTYVFEDQKYSMFRFQKASRQLLNCFIADRSFYILISPTGFKIAAATPKLLDTVIHPEKFGFEHREAAFTARGFIWSRSIPLLKETIFAGHGPDTFPLYFPQEDIIGKLNAYGTANMFVDKPHNLYLQMAINTGIPSLLAFVALFLIYAVTSFKLYFKKNITGYKDYMGISVFSAISGYCVTGLANDSVVSVAPVFWVLLGLGVACNFLTKKEL